MFYNRSIHISVIGSLLQVLQNRTQFTNCKRHDSTKPLGITPVTITLDYSNKSVFVLQRFYFMSN